MVTNVDSVQSKDYGVTEETADHVKQQDVHEFMLHFLDQIETELKDYLVEHKRSNPFIDFFGGGVVVKKACLECGEVRTTKYRSEH